MYKKFIITNRGEFNIKKYNLKSINIYSNNKIRNVNKRLLKKFLKLLNVKIESKEKNLLKEGKSISDELRKNGYNIEYLNIQNNSINGCVLYNKEKLFFKVLSERKAINEIIGYINLYKNIPISKLKKVYMYLNVYILIFEYDESIKRNEGLLNDLLVKADYENYEEKYCKIINEILETYTSKLNKRFISEKYPMQVFFNDRVDVRLNKWYYDLEIFDYKIIMDKKEYVSVMKIIKETTKYFNKEHIYDCYLTQGDPNVLNIGVKPIFFDFETAGYNSILAEAATFIWSILFADLYFAPKYHKNSFKNHEAILDKNIKTNIDYKIDSYKNKIYIKYCKSSTVNRKIIVLKYLEKLRKMQINLSSDIKYFFVMRILCIFNLCDMEEQDKIYSIALLEIIYYTFEIYKTDVNEDLRKMIIDIVK